MRVARQTADGFGRLCLKTPGGAKVHRPSIPSDAAVGGQIAIKQLMAGMLSDAARADAVAQLASAAEADAAEADGDALFGLLPQAA
jgi:hypothetical protein